MNDRSMLPPSTADLRQRALSRWDNEGGALASGGLQVAVPATTTPLTDAELIHLRVRVIALENIVIALLATATGRPQELVCEIADIIRPRDGAVSHPLTIEAANLIDRMVERSRHYVTA